MRGQRAELVARRPSGPVFRRLGQPAVEPLAQLVGLVVVVRAPAAGDDDAGRGDAAQCGESEDLP